MRSERQLMCSGLERIARTPAAMTGWIVFTRPSSISGKPVTSDTSRTGMPSFLSRAAVPPVEMSSIPSSCKTLGKGGNAGLIGDTQQRALDSGHGKGLFLHVLETLAARAALY